MAKKKTKGLVRKDHAGLRKIEDSVGGTSNDDVRILVNGLIERFVLTM